jgi:hypothetical protein
MLRHLIDGGDTMKSRVEWQGAQAVFELSEATAEQAAVLEADYFERAGDAFVRRYPADLPHLKRTAENFARHGTELYCPTARPESEPWRTALRQFAARLAGSGVAWFLIGSCALAVRGLPVAPRDVNAVFPHVSDLERVRDLFAEETLLPLAPCEGWVAKAYGTLWLGHPVGIAFETANCVDEPEPIDAGPYAAAHLETLDWEGHTLNAPPLALLRAINQRRGRLEVVRLIEAAPGAGDRG